MVTRAGTASSPGIRTADGTGPGGSVSPFQLATTSPLGELGSGLAATRLLQAPEDHIKAGCELCCHGYGPTFNIMLQPLWLNDEAI